jgi:hypothetical protein
MTTWDADTPLPSIEINLHQSRSPTNLAREPSLSTSQLSANSKVKSRLGRDASSSSAGVDAGDNRDQVAGHGEESECEQRKRANTAHTNTSSTKRLDHTTSQLFSTFMNLRNSLPISAIMAMLLPPQRKEFLQTLAELFHAQNWISRSGITQSIAHEVPEHLRAILNQLKSKFQADEQFRKWVILFISEELRDTCKFPLLDDLLSLIELLGEAKGMKRVNIEEILQMGIDQLKTLDESTQQLLYERKHYHGLLVDMDGEISIQKERIQQLEGQLQFIQTKYPHLSLIPPNAPTPPPPNMPQLEMENGVPKYNPFWVCCLMLLDGSGVQCHGMNREWHQLHKPGTAGKWTHRRQCFRCGRTNKSNRKYLSDIEAKMLAGVTKTGRINPYGNQPRTSQQGPSRQTSSQPARHPVIISPTSPVKSPPALSITDQAQYPLILSPTSSVTNSPPLSMGYPPVNIPQPAQYPLVLSPASLVKNSATASTSYPSFNVPQPPVLQATPYDALPVIFTGNSCQPVPAANIPKTRVQTATTSALTFPAVAQEARTHPFQPALPANIPKMNIRTATMGALTFPAAAPEPIASSGSINSPSLESPDPEQLDFSRWMGITTIPGNAMKNHVQATQQVYGNGMDNLLEAPQDLYGNGQNNHILAAAQRIYGNCMNSHVQAAQQVYYNGTNHLQVTQQIYENGMNNQSIAGTKRPATTPPKSDLPSTKKAKLHPGFNVTNSTQETLRLHLQEVQKPWMSVDFPQNESDETSQSDNDSLFGDGDDRAASTSEVMSSLFGDNEGDATQALGGFTITGDAQGDVFVQYSGSSTTENNQIVKKSEYEMDCELFGEKYANERREKEAAKAAAKPAGQLDDSEVDLEAVFEADLMAALENELGC